MTKAEELQNASLEVLNSTAVDMQYPRGTDSMDPTVEYIFADGSVLTVHNPCERYYDRFDTIES